MAIPTPPLPWIAIISAAGFVVAVITGQWAVVQTQFSGQREAIANNKKDFDILIGALQSQIDRRLNNIAKDLDAIHRSHLSKEEFTQFEKRIFDQISTFQRQLQILEQTRPTTGELQATNANSQVTAAKLEERLRALEQYLLGQSKMFGQPAR